MRKKILALFFSAMLVVSLPAMSGVAFAQEERSPVVQAGDQCVDNVSISGLIPVVGAYQCLSGAFEPTEIDSTTELENVSWSSGVSIEDAGEDRQDAYDDWDEQSLELGLQFTEDDIIDAHRAEEDQNTALQNGQEALREHYSSQLGAELNHYNDAVERAFSVHKEGQLDDNLEDPPVRLMYYYHSGGTNTETIQYTESSSLEYITVTLPDGSETEVVAYITDIDGENNDASNFAEIEREDGSMDRIVSPMDYELTAETDADGNFEYHSDVQFTTELIGDINTVRDGDDGIFIDDPYGSGGGYISVLSNSTDRLQSIQDEFGEAQPELNQMVDDLYTTHDPGTVDPENYVSPATLYGEYAEEDHYSYSSAIATTGNLETDLSASMIIEADEFSEPVEGQLLASGVETQIGSELTEADRSGSVLDFDEEGTDTLNIDTTDGDNWDNISVGNVDPEFYEVEETGEGIFTVEIEEEGLQDNFVVLHVEYMADTDADGEETTQSANRIVYADEEAETEGIPSGLEVSEEYDTVNMGTVMVQYQTGDSVETQTLSGNFEVTEATNQATGLEEYGLVFEGTERVEFGSDNLQEQLEQLNEIEEILESRDDNDVSGGLVGDIEGSVLGFIGGASVVLVAGFFLLVLFLVGRVTSVA